MSKIRVILSGLLLCLGLLQAASAGPLRVSVQRLTLPTALKLARAALDACEGKGIQVAVTVVDRNGIVQAALRNTVAPPVALRISRDKAYTAAMFNASTRSLEQSAGSPLASVKGLLMLGGGLPVQVGGSLLGAVGVSGAPSGAQDESCARAGLEAVLDDLEMAD